MKKSKIILSFLVAAMLIQLGFVWDTPKDSKKTAPAAAAASKKVDLPFQQVMGALMQNMTLWSSLSGSNKKKAVEAVVLLYQTRENSAILRPADFYVSQIDQSLKSNPALQSTDLLVIVKLLAVMEYDFYNGQNKDELAKEVLGEKMYEAIRARRQ